MERNEDKPHHAEDYSSVIIACVHSLVQKLLENYITEQTDYEVVSPGHTSGDILKAVKQYKPAAAFVCYDLDNGHGPDLARAIKLFDIRIGIVGLSSKCSEIKILRMLDAGAKAF